MAIIRWEPFRMEDIPELRLPKFGTELAVDVYEDNKTVYVQMHLPGVDPDDVEVEIEDNYLKISGEREEEKENQDKNYYYQEIQRGSFERMVRLPSKVDPTKATAEFEDGVLTVMIPKSEIKQAQKVKPSRKSTKREEKVVPKSEKQAKTKAKPKGPAKK